MERLLASQCQQRTRRPMCCSVVCRLSLCQQPMVWLTSCCLSQCFHLRMRITVGDSVEIFHFDMSRKIRMTIQMEVGIDKAQNVMTLRQPARCHALHARMQLIC